MEGPDLLDVVLKEVGPKEMVIESDGEGSMGVVRETESSVQGDDQLMKRNGNEGNEVQETRRNEPSNKEKDGIDSPPAHPKQDTLPSTPS